MSEEQSGLFSKLTDGIGNLPKLFKSAMEVRDQIKFNDIEIAFKLELSRILTIVANAQQEGIKANNEIVNLNREIERLREQLEHKETYALYQVATGVFCYIQKESTAPFTEVRKLCCNCYEKGVYSTLQQWKDQGFDPVTGKQKEKEEETYSLQCNDCRESHSNITYFG